MKSTKALCLLGLSIVASISIVSVMAISSNPNYVTGYLNKEITKASGIPYTLDLTELSSSDTSLTSRDGNEFEFELLDYNNGLFNTISGYRQAYVKNRDALNGIQSISLGFQNAYESLVIKYGWKYNGSNQYPVSETISSTEAGQVITYTFNDQCPSYFALGVFNCPANTQLNSLSITYSCSESVIPPEYAFDYQLINGNTEYRITGISSHFDVDTTSEIVFPETYNGKPVTSLSGILYTDYENTSIKSIVINSNFTNLSAYYFRSFSNLRNITVNNSNTQLSSSNGILYNKDKTELIYCPRNYQNPIEIENTTTAIKNYAFYRSTALTTINIPEGITSIGECAFANCERLTSVVIPSSISEMDSSIFESCYNLSSVTLTSGITTISDAMFYNCRCITSISIPNTVTSIGNRAFYGVSWYLSSIIIPDSVLTIGDQAFYNCFYLNRITLGSGITSIGDEAFRYCGMNNPPRVLTYNGFIAEWANVVVGANALPANTITCLDGEVTL